MSDLDLVKVKQTKLFLDRIEAAHAYLNLWEKCMELSMYGNSATDQMEMLIRRFCLFDEDIQFTKEEILRAIEMLGTLEDSNE